jgi:hypothetical protein
MINVPHLRCTANRKTIENRWQELPRRYDISNSFSTFQTNHFLRATCMWERLRE